MIVVGDVDGHGDGDVLEKATAEDVAVAVAVHDHVHGWALVTALTVDKLHEPTH